MGTENLLHIQPNQNQVLIIQYRISGFHTISWSTVLIVGALIYIVITKGGRMS